MDKKAMQMAISTLILIVIGILVLVAIAYALTDGFKKFRGGTDAFLDAEAVKTAMQVCNDACSGQIPLTYCCQAFNYQDSQFFCSDERLQLECPAINCEDIICED